MSVHIPDHHYFLRPRTNNVPNYNETSDSEYSDGEDGGHDSSNSVMITISGVKRLSPNPAQMYRQQVPQVHVGPVNDDLPEIPFAINNFPDLMRLARHCAEEKQVYKDCQKLPLVYPVLQELEQMVGQHATKDGLCDFFLHELQNVQTEWRNMFVTGGPGLGKTTIVNIIAKVLNRMGQNASDEVTVLNLFNVISDYEGQTKTCVRRLVEEALSKSGILLVDEADMLNDNRHNADHYGKQAMDAIMQAMNQYPQLIFIFSGYRAELERNILKSNRGMRRRIQWFFHLADYTAEELFAIFRLKLQKGGFSLAANTRFTPAWFQQHYQQFPFFGGSVEGFVNKIRTQQTKRTFGHTNKNLLTDDTIQAGFDAYMRYVYEPGQACSAADPVLPSLPFMFPFFSPQQLTHNLVEPDDDNLPPLTL